MIDECPGCRSRTRRWRDKLWNDDRSTWIDCQNEWHDATEETALD